MDTLNELCAILGLMMGTLNELCAMLHLSPKNQAVLTDVVNKSELAETKIKLCSLSKTRWVER